MNRKKKITLKATRGLNPLAVNNVSMKLGEGLVGTALKEIRIICEETGKDNPNFKYYPGTGEEEFDAFLAVPIIRGLFRIGVLVVQSRGKKLFDDNDIMALRAIASQLATVLEHVKLLMSSDSSADTEKNHIDLEKFQFLKGKTASQGSVLAPVMLKDHGKESELLTREMFNQKYT
jgi:phosphotransferase system enzyme I (PtsP)